MAKFQQRNSVKKLLTLLILATAAQAATVDVKFDYNFTDNPACTATRTTNCVSGFRVGFLNGSTLDSKVNIPLPANPSGQVVGLTSSFTSQGIYGGKTIAAVAVGKDAAGVEVISDPTKATSPIVLLPGAPLNITVTVTISATVSSQ
jgi:hypothetical protein